VASKAWHGARSGAEHLGSSAKDAAEWTRERLPSPEQVQAVTSTAATQVQQTVQKAAAWAQDKLPAAEQVEDAAKRTLDLAKAGIARFKKRSGPK
jgi:hypothetical protein